MELVKTMNIELIGPVSIYIGVGIQVVFSLILGGLVGYDREKKHKSAGLKTNILICLGATLYTSIGLFLSASAVASGGISDPARMAAQIVSGIGFLGAGAIIQGRGGVIGLTTAATIWVVAAIGFTIGSGYPFTAMAFSVTVLVILKIIDPLYSVLISSKNIQHVELEVLSRGSAKKVVLGILEGYEIKPHEVLEEKWEASLKGEMLLTCCFSASPRKIEHISSNIESSIKVKDVAYHFTNNHSQG